MIWRVLLVALVVSGLGGCVTVPPEAGFDDVERLLADRSLPHAHWNQGTDADRAVAERVRSLLASTLTADAAVEVAVLNNRRLQGVYEDLSIAQADLVQAGLLRNPSIDAELRFPIGGGGTGAHLGIEHSLVSLFFMPLKKRLAGAAFEAAKLRVAGAVVDHAAEAREAFFRLQAAEQLLELRGTVLAALEASYDLAKRIHDAGNITDLDLALERTQYEDAKLDLNSAEVDAAVARTRLDGLMGVFGARTAWRAAPRMPDLPSQEIDLAGLERRAIERSLDLGVIRQQILAAGEKAQQGRLTALLTDFDVSAESEREPEGTWTVGPGIVIPLPIFDQGQAVAAGLEARLRQARELRAAVAVEVRAGVRAARARVVASRERVEYLRKVILPLREQVTSETQLQYNAMQFGGFRLLDARRQQVETGARYVRELREYWLARTQLERIVNGRLGRVEGPEMSSMGESSAMAGVSEGGH